MIIHSIYHQFPLFNGIQFIFSFGAKFISSVFKKTLSFHFSYFSFRFFLYCGVSGKQCVKHYFRTTVSWTLYILNNFWYLTKLFYNETEKVRELTMNFLS